MRYQFFKLQIFLIAVMSKVIYKWNQSISNVVYVNDISKVVISAVVVSILKHYIVDYQKMFYK